MQVSGLSGVAAIAAGWDHSLALKDGTAWAWGANTNGQLGNGTTTDSNIPVQISKLRGVSVIAGGWGHTLIVKKGKVLACGSNTSGQLGDGTTINRHTLVKVKGLSGVKDVAGGFNHSLALKKNGKVHSWGSNNKGQLGDGTKKLFRETPVPVRKLKGVFDITAGYDYSLVAKKDGTLWSWGKNSYGELGDGTNIDKNIPVRVKDLLPSACATPVPTPTSTP